MLGPRLEAAVAEELDDEIELPIWAVALSAVAHIALAAVLWGLVWATIPRMFGWQPTVITGGSMQPTIDLGDIVVTRPLGTRDLVPGEVVTFQDPSNSERLITHRVVEVMPDGSLRTRGDNNGSVDTQLVAPSTVQGRATLRIPYLGRPLLWLQNGEFLALALVVVLLVGLVWIVSAFPL